MRKKLSLITHAIWPAIALFGLALNAQAKPNIVEITQKSAELQIRRLLEPLLDKYCHDECKLMSVNVSVDLATPEEVAPGFEEIDSQRANSFAPSSARVKMLIADKVGPVSRGKLIDLLQQFLDTLDYPVKIDAQITHFPQPVGSAGRIADMKDRVTKQFKTTLETLFQQFCPDQCLLADYNISTELVNSEEAQYGATGEFIQDGDLALKIKNISASILIDDTLSPEERNNILEMAKLKTGYVRNVNLSSKAMRFPRPDRAIAGGGIYGIGGDRYLVGRGLSSKNESNSTSDSKSAYSSTANNNTSSNSATSSSNDSRNTVNNTSNETSAKQERFERFEKIERVENGDAVQAELQKFKVYGLIFGCSILSLLIFIVMATYRPKFIGMPSIHRWMRGVAADPAAGMSAPAPEVEPEAPSVDQRQSSIAKRYEIDRLIEELTNIFASHPRVAKHVFSRILTEEGVEVTSQYIHIFGEGIVVDMLRDPSLQTDLAELMEFYAKNPMEIKDDEKIDLLRKLHNRTIAGKLAVLGNRSSNLFDFLAEMDGIQILELIRNENLTVKAIVLTQCDSQKRAAIYTQLDDDVRMKILSELSRIDYLPRDYIFNVANALKRKRRDNPRLNTEALPGSEVLISLLERTGPQMQRTVVKNLEAAHPDNARNVKSKLVSIDTLRFLRDGQLLEVVLSLRHDELLQFLKGAPQEIRNAVFSRSPKELVAELEEELEQTGVVSRESYQNVERKVLNRMKVMANEGLINLVETNERMFSQMSDGASYSIPTGPQAVQGEEGTKKVVGW